MFRRSICLTCIVLVLGVALAATAQEVDLHLAGWWKLDGDVLDSSGNGRHGTIVGDPQFVAGYYGQALQLDGIDDYVEITGWAGILGSQARTVAAWIRTSSTATGEVIGWGPNTARRRMELRINASRLRCEHQGGNVQGDTNLVDGEWHHAALTIKENATVSYPDARLYLDGVDDTRPSTDPDPFDTTAGNDVRIGSRPSNNDRFFNGTIDDVRVYERELTPSQIQDLFNGLSAFGRAYNPDPADGAEYSGTYVVLSWESGIYAAQHDVYFGDNFTDVDAGTPDTAKDRQSEKFLYVPALVAGTTYYWRVDDVEADGATIHKGRVWSFAVPPLVAYNPNPADGTRYADPDASLSWTAGYGAILHDVYFGADPTAVEDADTSNTTGIYRGRQPATSYTPPEALEFAQTYYWRIDEVETDMTTLHKGDVWSFKTIPEITITDPNLVCWWTFDEGEGITAVDWSGHGHHGSFRGNPQWVPGYDGYALRLDGLDDYVLHSLGAATSWPAFTVTLWVTTDVLGQDQYSSPFSSHVPNTAGFQIDTDGANPGSYRINDGGSTVIGPVTTDWVHLAVVCQDISATLYYNGNYVGSSTLEDSIVNQFAIGANRNAANWFAGTIDIVRVYDKVLTQDEIRQAMRGDPLLAWDPDPGRAAIVDIEKVKPLTWSAGDNAAQHDVYFGTDPTAVEDADSSDTSGIYRMRQTATSYSPPETLEFGRTYYWRIDEYNTDATVSKGRLWSFTVADYRIVDDMEEYDDLCNRIFYSWTDGFGHSADPDCGVEASAGNGSSSTVGYLKPPFAEQTNVHEGDQAMPFDYDNVQQPYYSEAQRVFQTPQDWTKYGAKALALYFRGYPPSYSTFTEGPPGTYTMTARSANISGQDDHFHYVFKRLSGVGTIVAKIESVTDTANDAKAGIMVRETLDPNSSNAFVFFRPDGGVRFNRRLAAGDDTTSFDPGGTFTAPHWLKLERYLGGSFRAYHSDDGSTWEELDSQVVVTMDNDVLIGLALCGQNTGATCAAVFSEVTMTGTVTGQWQSQDIGIESNVADQLYVAVEDSAGQSAVVNHEDPEAVLSDTYQEWNIYLRDFENVDMTRIAKMFIGVGNRNNPQSGGTGTLYVDDIRLYWPRCVASLAKPAGDFSNNCVVDYADVEILGDNWLISNYEVTPVAPSDANLVAHYKFDGNANDSSGSGNHGVEMNGPTYTAGKIGQAISLDGLNDYVAIQNLNYASSGHPEVTVCAWIRTSNEENQAIASFDRDNYWRFEINGNGAGPGQVGWSVMSSAGQMDYGSDSRVDDGEWHHVAGVFDNGTLSIYVDGNREQLAVGGSTYGTGNTRYGFVGSRSEADVFDGPTGTPWHFDGELDDVRIYSRALSQAEVAYLAGKTATFTQPLYLLLTPADPAMNMHDDRSIDLKDYAVLVDTWLDEVLWPQP